MSKLDSFLFDGRQVTAKQLRKEIPVYGVPALQTALESGCQSVAAVMTFLAKRDNAVAEKVRKTSAIGCKITNDRIKSARRQWNGGGVR